MRRRLLIFLAQIPLAFAIAGIVLFIGGIIGEYLVNRQNPFSETDPTGLTLVALIGLALAATMFVVWFVSVALLLGAQARRQGSGYGEAYRLIEAFKFDDAIPLLEQSIAEGKETVDVLMLLASAYAYAGQLADAQKVADRTVYLFPDDPDAYLTLSNVYRIQAMYDPAAEVLQQAVMLDDTSAVVWAELGFMELYAGRRDKAMQAFEKAAKTRMPTMYAVRVYYHLAELYAMQDDARRAAKTAAKMVSARDGLQSWKSGLDALKSTHYGQCLTRELQDIERALQDADAAHSG